MLLLQAHNKDKCQTMSEILQIKVAQIDRSVTNVTKFNICNILSTVVNNHYNFYLISRPAPQ